MKTNPTTPPRNNGLMSLQECYAKTYQALQQWHQQHHTTPKKLSMK
nr:hypothetical protein [uncultured Alloprevotella sp.]